MPAGKVNGSPQGSINSINSIGSQEELISEQPRGQFASTQVTQAESESWCCNDFCGCADDRWYVGNASFSSATVCCCIGVGGTVAGAGVVVAGSTVVNDKSVRKAGASIVKESVKAVAQNLPNAIDDFRDALTPQSIRPTFPSCSPPANARIAKQKPVRPPPPRIQRIAVVPPVLAPQFVGGNYLDEERTQ